MRKFFSGLRSIMIFALVISMLTMAALYIGAARSGSGSAAYLRGKLPSGVRARGTPDRASAESNAADWLGIAYAAVGCGENGGYAFADEDLTKKLYAFAAPLLSEILSESTAARAVEEAVFSEKFTGDFVLLRLHTPLPMTAVGLLLGGIDVQSAISGILADTFLLSFDAAGNAALYVTDGAAVCGFDAAAPEKRAALSALASAEALHPYTCAAPALCLPSEAPTLSPIFLSQTDFASSLSEECANLLFSIFGFNPEKQTPRRNADGFSTVEPQGQMDIASRQIQFIAAEDNALPLSDFGKADTAGVSAVFSAAAGLLDRIQAVTKPQLFGDAELYLAALGYTDGVYTLQFGLSAEGVPILLDGGSVFMTVTAAAEGITAVWIYPCAVAHAPLRTTRFAADWQYAHAARRGEVRGFALIYAVHTPDDPLTEPMLTEAEWYAAFAETEAEQ